MLYLRLLATMVAAQMMMTSNNTAPATIPTINTATTTHVTSHTSSALSKHWRHMKRFYPKSNLHGYDRDCDVHIDKPTFILKVIFFVLDLVVDVIG